MRFRDQAVEVDAADIIFSEKDAVKARELPHIGLIIKEETIDLRQSFDAALSEERKLLLIDLRRRLGVVHRPVMIQKADSELLCDGV